MKPSVTSQKKVANAIFRKTKEFRYNIKVKRETSNGIEYVIICTDFIYGSILEKACKLVNAYREIYSENNVGWYAESFYQDRDVRLVIYVKNDDV